MNMMVPERHARNGHVVRSREGSPRLPRPRSEEIPLEDMGSKASAFNKFTKQIYYISLSLYT
jgi:hypothetical protein